MRMPNLPGDTLWFPVVQRCAQGETRWIQIPVEGEPEPDEPAPGVTLTDAVAASGAPGEDPTAEESVAAPADADDGEDGALVWVAVALGAGGLAAGVAALAVTFARRPRGA